MVTDNAPVSFLPSAANDARPALPVFYQTHTGAQTYAVKLAMAASPEGLAKPVEFVCDAWQAKGAAAVFVVKSAAPGDDYVVREASAAEMARAQQAGIRAEVERLYEHAREEDAAADKAKSACFVKIHSKWAAESRSRARELETRLMVSGVWDCAPVASCVEASR